MYECPYCNGTGLDLTDGGQCTYCDGTGMLDHPASENQREAI